MSASKRTVLLLHGWGSNFKACWVDTGWKDLLIEQGFNVLEIDLKGHGQRNLSHELNDYSDLAQDVLDQLPNFEEPIIAIGYSLGCKVLLEMIYRKQKMFKKIILGGLGDNAFSSKEALGEDVADYLENRSKNPSNPMVRALADYGINNGNDPLSIAACLKRTPNPIITKEKLSKIRFPTLIVCGDQDEVAYPTTKLKQSIHQSQEIILKGINHLDLPNSSEFKKATLDFLNTE